MSDDTDGDAGPYHSYNLNNGLINKEAGLRLCEARFCLFAYFCFSTKEIIRRKVVYMRP